MKVLAATRSVGKQREIRRVLASAGLEVVFPDDIWLHQSSAGDPVEDGDSFEANARHKAEYFARLSSMPTFADDSGLEVFSLGGAPGVHSKRWAGASGSEAEIDAANNAELLRRLTGAPESRRLARYRAVLFYLPSYGAVPTICQGDCTGRILDAPRGTNGFGYDPFFFSDELGRTFGEATDEEKDAVSHRGRALRALASALKARSQS
ncbi:MAG: non-canonical purine NTP pyrophosphatase [Propionibacteriales bacterium]|nr:non-canonical purine NTP pyrophosphatase [Propionibacteriales bacterium]